MSAGVLIDAIQQFLGENDPLAAGQVRSALEHAIAAGGAGELRALKARLAADDGWAYSAPDPLARRIHHALADRFVDPASSVTGAAHLTQIGQAPAVIVANHLSYADANVIELLLRRSGPDGAALANRLTALAGPKIFSSRARRFSSLCFGTIKVPQSTDVSSEEAVLNVREVARAAKYAIDIARERVAAGDVLVLFAEGTRSRTGALQRLLPAVARYLELPGTVIIPVGLTGPEALFPVDGSGLTAARITMAIGRARRMDDLMAHGQSRRVMTDAIGFAIAELLPAAYRGVYADAGAFPEAAALLAEASLQVRLPRRT